MENVETEVTEVKELLYKNCCNALGPMSDLSAAAIGKVVKRT
jgi:hypothetical protein